MTMMLKGVLGLVIGAAIGYAVYRIVGCRTGYCPLTGNPWMSTGIWAAMGAMVAMGK